MNEEQLYVKFVMNVLQGLKCECEKFEFCPTSCNFYNKSTGSCYLHVNPCDYELQALEKAITEIIHEEKDGEQ